MGDFFFFLLDSKGSIVLLNFFHNNKVVHAHCGKGGNAEKHH